MSFVKSRPFDEKVYRCSSLAFITISALFYGRLHIIQGQAFESVGTYYELSNLLCH